MTIATGWDSWSSSEDCCCEILCLATEHTHVKAKTIKRWKERKDRTINLRQQNHKKARSVAFWYSVYMPNTRILWKSWRLSKTLAHCWLSSSLLTYWLLTHDRLLWLPVTLLCQCSNFYPQTSGFESSRRFTEAYLFVYLSKITLTDTPILIYIYIYTHTHTHTIMPHKKLLNIYRKNVNRNIQWMWFPNLKP